MSEHETQHESFNLSEHSERMAAVEARLTSLEEREHEQLSEPVTQPSSDFTHAGIELVGRHLPEPHSEVVSAHERQTVELPGTYEIGAVIEGAFIPIARLKAAEVLEAIERAKSSDDDTDDS